MILAAGDPRNEGVLGYLQHRNERQLPPLMLPGECPFDPYMSLGCHPDVVERLGKKLSPVLPPDCPCIIYGTPSLAAPQSGIVLAIAVGTNYALRLSKEGRQEAIRSGVKTAITWPSGRVMDLHREFGMDWAFGNWCQSEAEWLLATYCSVKQPCNPRFQS